MEILARAVGRRKEAVAQVQLVRGNGQFIINDKPAQAYLQNNSCSLICIKSPLQAALSLFSVSPLVSNSLLTNTPNNFNNISGSRIEGEQEITTAVSNELNETLSLTNDISEEQQKQGQNENSQLPPNNISSSSLDQINDAQPSTLSSLMSEGTEGEKFALLASQGEIDIIIKVKGGGLIGQAEAIKLGVARAFCIMENASGGAILRKILKTKGYLTQDSRVKERRKYGLKKARKASQYHKR